jgi:hypothetical protein
MIKIYKELNGKDKFSEDHIFQILDSYFSKTYKLKRITYSIFSLKKLYKYKSNGWEMITKQLVPTDEGLITIKDKKIIVALILDKQLVITVLGGFLLIFMLWKAFGLELFVSVILTLILAVFSWILIIINSLIFLIDTLEDIRRISIYDNNLKFN